MSDPWSVMEEIAEVAGEEIVRTLRLEYPGVKVYFPQEPKEDSPLVAVIGLEAARTLGQYFGGDWVAVPTGKAHAVAAAGKEKRRIIHMLAEEGKKIKDIALEVGVTERWVYVVLADRKSDPNQGDLFIGWPSAA